MGLFKKKVYADSIYTGGVIHTMDPDYPEAEAIAIKDGQILDLGTEEALSSLENDETQVYDLGGMHLCPGLIQTDGFPVRELFSRFCLELQGNLCIEEILEKVKSYAESHPEQEAILGFGYKTALFTPETAQNAKIKLDEACANRPVLLLSAGGLQGWANSAALDEAEAIAEAEVREAEEAGAQGCPACRKTEDEEETVLNAGALKDPYPPFQFFLRDEEGWPTGLVVGPASVAILLATTSYFDREALYEAFLDQSTELCEQGYTAVYDNGSPSPLHDQYMDLLLTALQNGETGQRFFGCLSVGMEQDASSTVRRLLQRTTACTECSDFIYINTLRLAVSAGNAGLSISAESLNAFCEEAGDRGCDVQITTDCREGVEAALSAFKASRGAGYRKNRLTLTCTGDADPEEYERLLAEAEVDVEQQGFSDRQARMEALSTGAAYRLHAEDRLGSLERGKNADFAVFAENPYADDGPLPEDHCAVMTVLNGEPVYSQG